MTIHYLEIFTSAIVAMIVGSVWYGPIFGKRWMDINSASKSANSTPTNPESTDSILEARKEMQKKAGPLYAVQFILTLFQLFVLDLYIQGWAEATGVENALWIFAAFVMPTIAGCSMWTADTGKVKWSRFLIQSGYQLVIFIIFGAILGLAK